MTFFTDSPFERMMVQKPQYRREKRTPALPKGCLEQSHDRYHDLINAQKASKPE